MTELDRQARRTFWTRPGTFAIVGGFEGPKKLSWMLLEHCRAVGIDAVPVNPDVEEVLGIRAVADPGAVSSLAGVVCVRLDPHATAAVEDAARLGVPVWLSQGTVSDDAWAAALRTEADLIAGSCPYLYVGSLKSHHRVHEFVAKLFRRY